MRVDVTLGRQTGLGSHNAITTCKLTVYDYNVAQE
jgi:hypothetical protein